jgi:hypothetical protein
MTVPALQLSTAVTLPATAGMTGPMLAALTQALGVERSILAGDDQIAHALARIARLPARHRRL